MIFQFGPFELDRKRWLLRRRGRRVRLSSSLMELLALFVSHPEELITREQIAKSLWSSPEMVDTTAGINTAVNRLRSALQDDAEQPTYIETVVGLGYRFIAEVRGVDEPAGVGTDETAGSAAAAGLEQSRVAQPPLAATQLAAAQPDTAVMTFADPIPEPGKLAPESATVPEISALNGGGRRWISGALLLVLAILFIGAAVFWLRRPRPGHLAVTSNPASSFKFQQVTFNDEANQVSASAVSHSGALLAYADPSGLTIRLVGVGADRFVASPEAVVIDRLAWSKGDQSLIASATDVTTGHPQVWSIGLDGGPARSVIDPGADAIVSPLSGAILFTREQRTELWTLGSGENAARRVLAGKGETFLPLTWILHTDLVVLRRCTLPNETQGGSLRSQYRCTYAVLDVKRGSVLTTEQKLSANSASISPDGQVLLPENTDEGSASKTQLVSADANLGNGRLLSQPTYAGTVPGFFSFSLSGSDDGEALALVVRRRASDIYSAGLRNGSLTGVTKLQHPAPDNYPHAWTSDGQSIIYESTQSGRSWIYRQKPGDAKATLLARAPDEGSLPQLTPDAKWIVFENLPANPAMHIENSLFRIPQDGGKLEIVPTHGRIDDFYCSVSRNGICVLRETIEQQFVYYKLDAVSGQGEELARTDRVESEFGDWSVSPDGRWVALPLHGPEHSGIRLVSLCGKAQCAHRDIPVSGAGELLETTWSADSTQFYVEAKRDTGFVLLRVDQGGRYTPLTTSAASIWGVPSRDGRHLAYPAQTTSTNVWAVGKRAPSS